MISYLFIVSFLNIIFYGSCQVTSTFVKSLANDSCGISTGAPIVQQLTLATAVLYAGGLFWSDDGDKIAYIDRYGPAFGRYTPSDGRCNRMQLNEGQQSVVIFPVNNVTGLKFVIGLDKLLILAVVTGTGNDLKYTLHDLMTVSDIPETFMRGRCDNKGRLWYSSCGHGTGPTGNLYKIDNLKTPQIIVSDLYCGGGMAWTKDYKNFYLVDSHVGIIYKYNFDSTKGTLSDRRIIFRLADQPNLTGKPFDVVVDTNGYLWIGMLGGGSVIQYDENTSSVIWTIGIPASDIVSLEFGGLEKDTLYVGTAKNEKNEIASGAIFAVSGLGVTGIRDNNIVIPQKYSDL